MVNVRVRVCGPNAEKTLHYWRACIWMWLAATLGGPQMLCVRALPELMGGCGVTH